ncbi:MAG: Na+/H+ antiporter NhaA [Candidatus Rokuibacteriota bacterium]|nr:MAG: Na+/H+ antiporter NhaA [Candidatus Rokubacteria bacterium]
MPLRSVGDAIHEFLRLESAGGILLMLAAATGLVLANTSAEGLYQSLLGTPVEIRVGALTLAKPLVLWINDGLMAVFFLLVGLEIKREVVEGELVNPAQIVLPALAAAGGMAAPAALYWWLNGADPIGGRGWAIPAATDIAFALGVLSLLGPRVPRGLKVFLVTVAILDDLGAIVVIALFYTAQLSWMSLGVAVGAIAVLAVLNLAGTRSVPAYFFVGLVLWVAVLKSGVHATLAGVALALFIPIRSSHPEGVSPLRRLEHDLHPVVAFGILPLFALANAGVSVRGLSLRSLLDPVPLGILVGLVVGKTVGVFGMSAAAIGAGAARMPDGASWSSLFGVSVLCGVGFTMSLFIANLAFAQVAPELAVSAVLGILGASLAAAVIGYFLVAIALAGKEPPVPERQRP